MLQRREALPAETRAALSRTILREIACLDAFEEARTVMAYAGFGSEIRTDGFLLHTLNEGKTLLLPRVNHRKRRLEAYEVEDPERDLEAGTWGIREPVPDRCVPADPLAIDFVLVPGLAFDARGGRLGYGGGFYDALISTSLSPQAWLVAGAFEAQMLEKVPMDDRDARIDLVVTEEGRYPPGPPQRRPRRRSH